MKRYTLLILLQLVLISGSFAQRNNQRHRNTKETYSTDMFGALQYENNRGFKATLKKDIFENMVYSDNNKNEVKYSEQHWINFLKDFRGDKKTAFAWLIDKYGSKVNLKEEYKVDIFGSEVYKNNQGDAVSIGKDIFGDLQYKSRDGFTSSLSTQRYDDVRYSDSNKNDIRFSKEEWNKIIIKFRGNEQDAFYWLMDEYSSSKGFNQLPVKIEKDAFGTLQYEDRNIKFKASLKQDAYSAMVYKDNNNNQLSLSKEFWNDMKKLYKDDNTEYLLNEVEMHTGVKNFTETYKMNVTGALEYKNNNGETARLTTDMDGNMTYSDSKGNKTVLNKEKLRGERRSKENAKTVLFISQVKRFLLR